MNRSRLNPLLVWAVAAASCTEPAADSEPAPTGPAAGAVAEPGEGLFAYRSFAEHVTSGDLEGLLALFSEEAIYRDRTFDVEVRGRPMIRPLLEATLVGFGDRRMEIRRIVASGDTVAVEWILHGVFSGPILGVPPDDQPIELEGVSIGVVSAGRITEHVDYLDRAALEARLGLRPEP